MKKIMLMLMLMSSLLFSPNNYAISLQDTNYCLNTDDYTYYSAFIKETGGGVTFQNILANTRHPSAFSCTKLLTEKNRISFANKLLAYILHQNIEVLPAYLRQDIEPLIDAIVAETLSDKQKDNLNKRLYILLDKTKQKMLDANTKLKQATNSINIANAYNKQLTYKANILQIEMFINILNQLTEKSNLLMIYTQNSMYIHEYLRTAKWYNHEYVDDIFWFNKIPSPEMLLIFPSDIRNQINIAKYRAYFKIKNKALVLLN